MFIVFSFILSLSLISLCYSPIYLFNIACLMLFQMLFNYLAGLVCLPLCERLHKRARCINTCAAVESQ